MKKIIFAICLLLVVLLGLKIMVLLGYHFNKDFLTFDKQQCLEKEFPTYSGHSGIQGCVFWMRNDDLEKKQSWETLFKKDEVYCSQKYKNQDTTTLDNIFSAENSDPKCDYGAFRNEKRNENWTYLVSTEKDGFYNYCAEQICPSQKMFK